MFSELHSITELDFFILILSPILNLGNERIYIN